ncbi:MAG: hypothetical protein ACD_62C00629G0003, partial [uncultured bacterium]
MTYPKTSYEKVFWVIVTMLPAHGIKKDILKELATIVGPQGYSTRTTDRLTYCRDANYRDTIEANYLIYHHFPSVIVWPETAGQIAALMKLAIKHKIKITTMGGGSGVCGGARPSEGNMVIDTKRLNHVLHCDREKLFIDVQTGILGLELEKFLARQGYTTGHFPVSILNATLGGYLATKAAGQFSSKYG